MKNKTPFLLLLSFGLISCANAPVSSFSSIDEVSSDTSSELSSEAASSLEESIASSEETTSESSSEGTTSESFSEESSAEVSSEESSVQTVEDFGLKTIAEAKQLIANRAIATNSHGLGVDYSAKVTIQGVAIEKFDLVKNTSKFGLNVSTSKKVLLGDGTDSLVVASDFLLNKVSSYANDPSSKYTVTGYLSLYLGVPELYAPDQEMIAFDSSLDVSVDYSALVKHTVDASSFFDNASLLPYNCAGHGYGEVIKMEALTCFYFDAGSSYFYFTDGRNFIKAIKNNVNCTVGSVYDLIGSYSLQNYAPALRLLSAEAVDVAPASVDYGSATERSITQLRGIVTSQEDTDKRYEAFTKSFGGLRYADVYFGAATENGKYYVGVSDTIQTAEITGRVNAQTGGMALIDNLNYWNAYADAVERYCPHYPDIFSEETVRVYYVPESLSYSSKKPCYKIFLAE